MNELPTLISKEEIARRVKELGKEIERAYQGKPLVCVGILKGSVIFFSDLVREINLPLSIDFLGASSYGQRTTSSGVVKITLDLSVPIAGKDVLLIEDVVDTGLTLQYILENLKVRKPNSLKLCALLSKPANIKNNMKVDYLGFEIENHFVVGYGLDAAEMYRNLPYLAILPEEKEPK